MAHPPGLVAVIAQETGRYTAFTASLASLELPPGSAIEVSTGSERASQRNGLVEFALDAGYQWVWFIDDDHVFAPDVVTRLLNCQVDVVQALCLLRRKPFPPAAFQSLNKEETHGDYLDLMAMAGALPRVLSAGSAGMLVKTSVFRQLEPPWFFQDDERSEDMRFCEQLRAAQIAIYVDITTVTGHLTTCAIYPVYEDGQWKVGFQVGGGYQVKVPIERHRPGLVIAR